MHRSVHLCPPHCHYFHLSHYHLSGLLPGLPTQILPPVTCSLSHSWRSSRPWYSWPVFGVEVCRMHWRVFSDISDPYTLDANSSDISDSYTLDANSTDLQLCETVTPLDTARCLLVAKLPLNEKHWARVIFLKWKSDYVTSLIKNYQWKNYIHMYTHMHEIHQNTLVQWGMGDLCLLYMHIYIK